MVIKLRMTGKQHTTIKSHVLAPDGKEAGALLLCEPVLHEETTILLIKEISEKIQLTEKHLADLEIK